MLVVVVVVVVVGGTGTVVGGVADGSPSAPVHPGVGVTLTNGGTCGREAGRSRIAGLIEFAKAVCPAGFG